MITTGRVRELLSPFEVSVSDEAIDKINVYVDLLLRWNLKINLTSIANAEECVTRHFGESFLLTHLLEPRGRLLDIGSGAGFPGLALKLIAPSLEVVLLEPVSKKRAFLKEVARVCDIGPIEVNGSRFEEFSQMEVGRSFGIITSRAVGGFESMVESAATLLETGGHICLWLGNSQMQAIKSGTNGLTWLVPVPIPLSRDRIIMVGTKVGPYF